MSNKELFVVIEGTSRRALEVIGKQIWSEYSDEDTVNEVSYIIHGSDDAATMGIPPDGETPLDVANEKFEEKVQEEYAAAQDPYGYTQDEAESVDAWPLFDASELLVQWQQQNDAAHAKIVALLDEIADLIAEQNDFMLGDPIEETTD